MSIQAAYPCCTTSTLASRWAARSMVASPITMAWAKTSCNSSREVSTTCIMPSALLLPCWAEAMRAAREWAARSASKSISQWLVTRRLKSAFLQPDQFTFDAMETTMACNPEILKSIPLFSLLDDDEAAVLAGQVDVKTFAPHERIYKAGE